jgi:hypothetical protein
VDTTDLPADRVSVPRVHLAAWARFLEDAANGDERLARSFRDQLSVTAEQVHYWSTQRTDLTVPAPER